MVAESLLSFTRIVGVVGSSKFALRHACVLGKDSLPLSGELDA